MNVLEKLKSRADDRCELCSSLDDLTPFLLEDAPSDHWEHHVLVCSTCKSQYLEENPIDINHWRALNESMWNVNPPVQVMAFRMLNKLRTEGWAQDLFDQIYLDEDTLVWAKKGLASEVESTPTLDSNGAVLNSGDTVTLIKDLVVKGANFTAKRGTMVRNINLTENPEQIEGKVNGTQIVLVSKFLKKA